MRVKKFLPLATLVAGAVVSLGAVTPSAAYIPKVKLKGDTNGVAKSASVVANGKTVKSKDAVDANSLPQSKTLRTGKLPNGMTYYVQYNPTPAKRAFIWLSVNAGSIQEDDDQRGFAHLLEHLAFNGTKNFSGNGVIDVIEKSGMTFGGDLNAYTSFDETVYQLTIPTDDPENFRQGMQIVDDWANQRILNDSMDVVNERGVVLGEWRTRLPDTASQRFQDENFARIFGKDSRYKDRFPIGLPEQLKTAEASKLIRYYQDWYRPDNMAIIVVGDFNVDSIEKDVKARFGTNPGPKNPRQFKRPEITKQNKTIVHLVKDKVPNPVFELQWPALAQPKNKEAAVKLEIVENILFPFLQRSFVEMTKIERRPIAQGVINPQAGFARPLGRNYRLATAAHPDSVMYGASVMIAELERVAQHGIPAEELEQAKKAVLRRYEQIVDGSDAVNSRQLAQLYSQNFLTGQGLLISPEERLSIARKVLSKLTAKDIAAVAKTWQNEKGRIVTISIPLFSTLRFVEEKQVLAMMDSVAKVKHSPETFLAAKNKGHKSGEVDGLGKVAAAPGKIVSGETLAGSDVKVWNLSNGSKVVYKYNPVHSDEVIMHAFSLGGHTQLADSLFYSSGRLVAMLMTASGGFGDMNRDDLDKKAATTGLRDFKVALNAFDEEVVVKGSPRELEMLFQLMHHQFVDPSVDTLALQEWRRAGFGSLAMSQGDQIAAQLSGGNRRLAPPQAVNVPFMNIDQAMNVYKQRFGNAADFTFYIIGAAPEAEVMQFVEKYIANIPGDPSAPKETLKDLKVRPPTGGNSSESEHPRFAAEQSQLSLNFFNNLPNPAEQPDSFRIDRQRLSVVSMVLTRRLRNKLREEMAVTYGTGASIAFYNIPDPRMYVAISLMTDPSVMDTSKKVIWEEIEEFQKSGPTAEELEMAKAVRFRSLQNAQLSNSWWITQFTNAQMNGLPLEYALRIDSPEFTSAEIAETAKKYMSKRSYQQVVYKPTKETLKKAKEEEEKKKSEVGKDTTDESKKKDGA